MAVKTITIDVEAYGILARRKRAGESFSQVIKREFGKRPTVGGLRAVLAGLHPGADTLDAIEAEVRGRRSSPARAARR
ncbi:MAG: antitoxin VapB family protein [Vicinamibacterales bacterium]